MSAVSKLDGTDVTSEIVGAPAPGENEVGYFLEIEDGPTSGGSGSVNTSDSIGDENTGAWVLPDGVAGSDATADGKYVRAARGFESVSGWGYRRECDPEFFSVPATCSDDSGVNLTFSYDYEGYASIEVPDLIAPHQASASVRPSIRFSVANFFGSDPTNLLIYDEQISLSNVGTDLVQEELDIFSGTFFVSLAPGTAFRSYANVNYNGEVSLVPLPASGLMLLAACLSGLVLRRKRSLTLPA